MKMLKETIKNIIEESGLMPLSCALQSFGYPYGCRVFRETITFESISCGSNPHIGEARKQLWAACKLFDEVIKETIKEFNFVDIRFTDMVVMYALYEHGFYELVLTLHEIFSQNSFNYTEEQMKKIHKAIKHLSFIEGWL